MEVEQASLFSAGELQTYQTRCSPLTPALTISIDVLQSWKQRIFAFQQAIITTPLAEQSTLFTELCASPSPSIDSSDPEAIDPFSLPQQNMEFWRWKTADTGCAALYFVIDYRVPVLLYVGETVKSNQRWKGEHDCKRYLDNYRSAHYHHQLPTQLGIAFWAKAPVNTRSRQRLESALIYKWRSPFNKENWQVWGTPFIGI